MSYIISFPDEYFLSNVKTIDDVTNGKQQRLLRLLEWPKAVQLAVTTWPCFNIVREGVVNAASRFCSACQRLGVAVRVFMYGQPYNSTTLEGCQPDPQCINEKVRELHTVCPLNSWTRLKKMSVYFYKIPECFCRWEQSTNARMDLCIAGFSVASTTLVTTTLMNTVSSFMVPFLAHFILGNRK